MAARFTVRELWHDAQAGPVPLVNEDCQIVQTSQAVIEKIAYRENPQGFIAVLESRTADLQTFEPTEPALILIASGLEKPGNIGAILRSAQAAGTDAVMIDTPGFDLFNPNCVRASTGAVFSMPVICDEAVALADWLKQHDILPIAATPEATMTMGMVNLSRPVALVVGAEAEGLSEFWRDAAEASVSIRMCSDAVDSLNVSVSAALLLFEAARQRGS